MLIAEDNIEFEETENEDRRMVWFCDVNGCQSYEEVSHYTPEIQTKVKAQLTRVRESLRIISELMVGGA